MCQFILYYFVGDKMQLQQPPFGDQNLKIFISYGREDITNEFVVRLYEDLQREGYDCTLDVKDFNAGDELSHVIPDNIDHCDVFIIILSQKYSKSGWCCAELKHAKYRQKKIDDDKETRL